jgi:hypothetical protein
VDRPVPDSGMAFKLLYTNELVRHVMRVATLMERTRGDRSGESRCSSHVRRGRGGGVRQERRIGAKVGTGASRDSLRRVAQDARRGPHVAAPLIADLVKGTLVGSRGDKVEVKLPRDPTEFVHLFVSAARSQNHQPALRLGQVVEPFSVMLDLQHASSKSWVDRRATVRSAQEVTKRRPICLTQLLATPPHRFTADLPTVSQRGADDPRGRSEESPSKPYERRKHRRASLPAAADRVWSNAVLDGFIPMLGVAS